MNPNAIVFWLLLAGIGYLVNDIRGAITGLVVGLAVSLLVDLFSSRGRR